VQPRPPHDTSDEPATGYVGRRRPAEQSESPADFLYGLAPDEHGEHGENGEHFELDYYDHPDGPDPDRIHGDDDTYRRSARRRRSGLIAAFSALIVIVLAVGGFVVIRDVIGRFGGGGDNPTDYSGTGTTAVSVAIPSGASTTDIANILARADVVASASLFLDAAAANPSATSIQPGTYELKAKMSAASALALLLDPASRSVFKVVIPEGYRLDQVVKAIADALGLDPAAVAATAANVAQVGLPAGFEGATSLEGMLFPATYDFGPGTSGLAALQAMTAKFTTVMASTGFVAKARTLGITPYEALKVASMAEAEATNFTDWSKVARVIYNRTDQGQPLGIDSTSVYEARLAGRDPKSIDYDIPTPYNTRRTPGFPPTPIGNPGEPTLRAAVGPAAGNWLYYVQTDAAGALSFTNNFDQFATWAQQCINNSWGNC
jgi:UPF0755 protein